MGPVLSYSEAEYQLVFTEPLIIAALAAPPCSKNIGQNWEVCATSFGKSTSTGVDAELTVSVKASAYVGVKTAANIPFVGEIGADFKTNRNDNGFTLCRWFLYARENSNLHHWSPRGFSHFHNHSL